MSKILTQYVVDGRVFHSYQEAMTFNKDEADLADDIRAVAVSAMPIHRKRWYETERDWLHNNADEIAKKLSYFMRVRRG